jgi:hypothetical protein
MREGSIVSVWQDVECNSHRDHTANSARTVSKGAERKRVRAAWPDVMEDFNKVDPNKAREKPSSTVFLSQQAVAAPSAVRTGLDTCPRSLTFVSGVKT